ncbi:MULTISPECIES: helix-turn-helix domain-containing protein [unclassified Bradyrhizobium]
MQARLHRWLLRASELAGPTLYFSPKKTGEMLGVRRTSVTVVAHTLQSAGLIKYARGKTSNHRALGPAGQSYADGSRFCKCTGLHRRQESLRALAPA